MKVFVLFARMIFASVFTFATTPYFSKTFGSGEKKQSATFIENKGQIRDQNYKSRPDVLYSGSTNGLVYHLRTKGISYQLNHFDGLKEKENTSLRQKRKVYEKSTIYRVDVNWLNIRPDFLLVPDKALSGYTNYYSVVCPNGVHNVKTYEGITYKNIYTNIDLHYYEKDGALKYDYIVAPNSNYKQIEFEIIGAEEILLQKDGSVILKTPFGDIREGSPQVFQSGKKLGSKWLIRNNVLSFEIEKYNPLLPLIIDPAVRIWGTYYGGSGYDQNTATSNDNLGNVYSSGYTDSNNNLVIATSGSHQNSIGLQRDAFLCKINSSGSRLWATYYGGEGNDEGYSCVVDPSGNVYLSGTTGSSVGISTNGSHQANPSFGYQNSLQDAFLVKFNSTGVRQWGTYYGGSMLETGRSCSTDAMGNVYLAGVTGSTFNIASPGSFLPTNNFNLGNLYLAKFNTSGVRQWGTYYGPSAGSNNGHVSCCTDASGNVILAGTTNNTVSSVMVTSACHQYNFSGADDIILVKFNSSGSRLWATYYGASNIESLGSCATDASDNVYLCGTTISNKSTLIATPGSHQPNTLSSGNIAFLVKFNSGGVRQWATYYGGLVFSSGQVCCTDASGNVFLAGSTNNDQNNNISTPGSHQTIFGGSTIDAFLVKFNTNGIRQWGTFHGGTGYDGGLGCSADAVGNVFLCGSTTSPVLGSLYTIESPSAHQTTYGGYDDGFVVKFDGCLAPSSPTNITSSQNISICANYSTTLQVASTNSVSWYSTASLTGSIGSGNVYVVPGLAAGVYTYYALASSSCQSSANSTSIVVTVNPRPFLTVNSGTICSGQSFTLMPAGASSYTYIPLGPVVSPTITSSYSISGTTSLGCQSYGPTISNVLVSPLPTLQVNNGGICSGKSFTIIPTGAHTYTFLNGQNIVSPTTNSSYSVSGTSTDGCVSSSPAVSNVTVFALPLISINSTNSLICTGENATLSLSNALSYTWASGSNAISISVSPTINTTYSVTGSDSNGCSNNAVFTLSVSECLGLQSKEVKSESFLVYPNPNDGEFTLELFQISSIKIMDGKGQVIFQKQFEPGKNSINLNDYARGIYFIEVKQKQLIEVIKIIKD